MKKSAAKVILPEVSSDRKTSTFEVLYGCFFIVLPLIYVNEIVDPVLIPRQIFLSVFMFVVWLAIGFHVYKKVLDFDLSFLKLTVSLSIFIYLLTIFISLKQSTAVSESIYVFSKEIGRASCRERV